MYKYISHYTFIYVECINILEMHCSIILVYNNELVQQEYLITLSIVVLSKTDESLCFFPIMKEG